MSTSQQLHPVKVKEVKVYSDMVRYKRCKRDVAYRRSVGNSGENVDTTKVLQESALPKDVILCLLLKFYSFDEVRVKTSPFLLFVS